jgi:predicted ATP-grasp superfamily ATP-dependent carboligase
MSAAQETAPERTPGRVLVTDGEFKHTLGIVRALASSGHEVHVLARSSRAPAVHSRAVRDWQSMPADPAAYAPTLLDAASRMAPVSVVLVGSDAMRAGDGLRAAWPQGVRVALPPPDSYAIAMAKDRTAELARSVGVDTPRTRLVASPAELADAWRELGSPLVLKSAREEGIKALRYVRTESELVPAFERVRADATAGIMAQEYVAGDGWGFSALYWNGRRVRSLMHRRVREWPPTGGASAAAESVPDCPPLERAGTALLDALRWHGVAMVEFKGDPARRLTLIEINAKFWGSHDVALAAGVRFPCDLVALLEGRDVRDLGPQPAVPRVRFTWPLGGDLWHGLFRPASLPGVLWDAMSPAVAHSFRWSDPAPHAWELVQWARSTPGALREARALR